MSTPTATPELLSRRDAAERLGVHPATLDRMVAEGLIGVVRVRPPVGRRTWLRAADVERVRAMRAGEVVPDAE